MTTATITETEAKFRNDPSTARSAPTVTGTLINGRARLSAGPFNWDADLPASLGGENLAPSPTAYLLGALAGCAVTFIRDTLAPQLEVEIDNVTAVARSTSDLRGLLGIDGVDPQLDGIQLDVEVASRSSDERLEALFAAWRERCPIYLALLNPNRIGLTMTRAVATS